MGVWADVWASLRRIPLRPGRNRQGDPSRYGSRTIDSMHPSKGLNPARLIAILDAAAGGDAYEQMELFEDMVEKDTELLGRYLDRIRPVANAPFSCSPGDESNARSVQAAEEAEAMLKGLDGKFRKALEWLLDGVGKGYAAVEVDWHTSANGVMPIGFAWRHQKWFTVDEETHSELRLLTETAPLDGAPLQPGKFIVHTHNPLSGDINRGGLFRPLAWIYLFRNFGLKSWVQLLEILGIPMRVAKYRPGTNPKVINVIEAAVKSMGRDTYAVIPDDATIEVIKTLEKQGGGNHKDLMDWGAESYALLLLGQNLTSRSGDKGARSLGEVHWAVKQEIKEEDATSLQGTITDQLLAPWCMWNFGAEVPPPRFVINVEEEEDLAALVSRDKDLQEMGYPLTRQYIQERYQLPEPHDDDDVLVRASQPLQLPPPAGDPEVKAELGGGGVTAGRRGLPAAPEPDEAPLLAALLERTDSAWGTIRDAIKQAVGEAKDHERARDLLKPVLSSNRAELEDTLFRGMLAAYLRTYEASRRRGEDIAAEVAMDDVPNLPNLGELQAMALRQGMTPKAYYALEAEHRGKAFTLAGVESLRAVEKVQDSLFRAEYDGTGFAEWLDQVDEIFEAHGITPMSEHRAELVYGNAIRQSQMAARYAEEMSPEGMERAPYWLYDAVLDDDTSAFCRDMDGKVFRKDDPIWNYATPPNHHGCRSTPIELSEAMVKSMGLQVASGEDIALMPDWPSAPAAGMGRVLRQFPSEDKARAFGSIPGLGSPDEAARLFKSLDGPLLTSEAVSPDQLRRGLVRLTESGVSGVMATIRKGGLRAMPTVLEAERLQAALDLNPSMDRDEAHKQALEHVFGAMGRRLDDLVAGASAASPSTLAHALYPDDADEVLRTLGVTSAPDLDLVEQLLRAIAGGV